jgi:hypothetical protein
MYSLHIDRIEEDDDTNSSLLSLPSMSNDIIDDPLECPYVIYNPHNAFGKRKRYRLYNGLSTTTSPRSIPMKGSIRCLDGGMGHRQIYSGKKWRRICSIPGCFACLSGRIYYQYWLCPKHCPQELKSYTSNNSENMSVDTTEEILLLQERRITRQSSHQIK